MPNPAYKRAAQDERDFVYWLRERGWVAYRTPASKGATDVVALKHGSIQLYQLKSGRTNGSDFRGFGPADRERLLGEAAQAGGVCCLVLRERGGWRFRPSEEWPNGD